MSSSAVIKGFNEMEHTIRNGLKLSCVNGPDLFAHCYQIRDSSQQPALVTAADTLASSSHHSADSKDTANNEQVLKSCCIL